MILFIVICTILFFWIAILIWVLVSYWIYKKKNYDKKTGWRRCSVCGKIPPEIYYIDGVFRDYHCLEHSVKREMKK
jgi:hypothetical protein